MTFSVPRPLWERFALEEAASGDIFLSAGARIQDATGYVESILRNISLILNSRSLPQGDLLPAELACSVLNFGVPDFVGEDRSPACLRRMERVLTAALRAFEPRLRPETVSVRVVDSIRDDARPVCVIFQVRAVVALTGQRAIAFRTHLNLDSGEHLVSRI